MIEDYLNVNEFLEEHNEMSLIPHRGNGLLLKGKFKFKAKYKYYPEIEDNFKLEIIIPNNYPNEFPKIREIDKRIPRNGKFHINSNDDTLCLGSPIRLLGNIKKDISLIGFATNCLIPFLYSASYKMRYGGKFPIGELDHGENGILNDYCDLFDLSTHSQAKEALYLLGIKKRLANKKKCPCGCNKRLGACKFHFKLNKFRKVVPVSWFRKHLESLGKGM